MLNQTGIKKQSFNNIKNILVDEKNSTSVSIVISNTGVEANSDGRKIVKAGTPVYGSLEARNVPFIISGTSVSATATAEVDGTGVTKAEVTAATFSTAVSGEAGTYVFTYDADAAAQTPDPSWKLDGSEVTLVTYGITPTGSPDDGDKITVTFTPAGTTGVSAIVLHDVDVTDGNANSQVVIFGTIDLNKLESDVQALITADVKSALKMVQFVR